MNRKSSLNRRSSLAAVPLACGFALMLLLYGAAARGESPKQAARTAELKAAINNPQRPAAERARDHYRHPLQTLQSFGIKPTMTVVEIWPGGGWYTNILAPYLKQNGKLYEAVPPGPRSDAYRKKIASDPNFYGAVTVT